MTGTDTVNIMRKRIFNFAVLAAAAGILAACSSFEEIPTVAGVDQAAAQAVDSITVTFNASFEQPDSTRTSLEQDTWKVKWSENDQIAVWARCTQTSGGYPGFGGFGDRYQKAKFSIDNGSISQDGLTATFTGSISVPDNYSDAKDYYALYPYSDNASASNNYFGKVSFSTTLCSAQTATAGTFADNVNISVAKSSDTNEFLFQNLCALLSFTVGNDDIVSAKLTANSGAGLAGGTALIDFSDSIPVMDATGDSGVTLSCEGNSTFTKGSKYYFVVYPGTYTGGFTITFKDKNGMVATMASSKELKLDGRNNVNLGTVTVPANKWTIGEVGVYRKSDNSVIRKYTKYSDQLVWSVKSNVNGFRIQDITARTFFNISNLPATYTDKATFKASITQNVIDGVAGTFEDTVTVTNIDDELVRLTGSTYYYIIKK